MAVNTSTSLCEELLAARQAREDYKPVIKQAYEDRVAYEAKRNVQRSFPLSKTNQLMASTAFIGKE